MSCSRYYCDFGCKTAKNNPCYFLNECNRDVHYLKSHRNEFFDKFRQEIIKTFMESKEYPLARLCKIFRYL
jgi:hypothetical protein